MKKHQLREMYLDMVRRCVVGLIYRDANMAPWEKQEFLPKNREEGWDWPSMAHTMTGNKRIKNLKVLAETLIQDQIPGDFIETGVWRGGSCIFMAAILKAHGITDRRVWVCDSFAGLPEPDAKYPADTGDHHHTMHEWLAVSLEQVKENFTRYNLLSNQVQFVKGFFEDTLPTLDTGPLALMRLDGDMYSSTIVAMENLYPKLNPGGFVVIDDWTLPTAKQAVYDYMNSIGVEFTPVAIDPYSVYWRKN
jgi:predicted O-methyltransferase YrrM